MDHIQKEKQRIQDNILKSYTGTDDLQKGTLSDELEKGGKRATIGEVRVWDGVKVVKHADGWVILNDKTNKHVLELPGGKRIPATHEHIRHADDHLARHNREGGGKPIPEPVVPEKEVEPVSVGTKQQLYDTVRSWGGDELKNEYIQSVLEGFSEAGIEDEDFSISKPSSQEHENYLIEEKVKQLIKNLRPGLVHEDMDFNSVRDVVYGLVRAERDGFSIFNSEPEEGVSEVPEVTEHLGEAEPSNSKEYLRDLEGVAGIINSSNILPSHIEAKIVDGSSHYEYGSPEVDFRKIVFSERVKIRKPFKPTRELTVHHGTVYNGEVFTSDWNKDFSKIVCVKIGKLLGLPVLDGDEILDTQDVESSFPSFENTKKFDTPEKVSAEVDRLFKELVPGQGKADTVEGEVIRALNKVGYRFYNDGDLFFESYGAETAGSAATFLYQQNQIPELKQCIGEMSNSRNNSEYEDHFQRACEIIVNHIDSKNGVYTPNTQDMLDTESKWVNENEEYDPFDEDEDDDEVYDPDQEMWRRR